MTRKDFQLIADVMSDAKGALMDANAHDALANAFARKLKATNARFDYNRFVDACGVKH
jgi:hypothetical protein